MKNESWGLALKVMANISGWIAFPVIIGLYLGKWLDKKFGTDPWLFLITIGFCFFISMFGLTRSALKEFKQVDKEYQGSKRLSGKLSGLPKLPNDLDGENQQKK